MAQWTRVYKELGPDRQFLTFKLETLLHGFLF